MRYSHQIRMKYFFDTYAIIEILKDSESYKEFIGFEIITSAFNISEAYYFFIEYNGKGEASKMFDKLKFSLLDVDREIAIKASLFRHENKKLKLSYADCIGYCLSKENGLIFLTGDDGFKNLDNVEFVK